MLGTKLVADTLSGRIFTLWQFGHGAQCCYECIYFLWLWGGGVCVMCACFVPLLLHCQLRKSINSWCSFCLCGVFTVLC
jgi:hypothetical protein